MIRAVSFHAIERLQERRGLQHLLRHLHKVQKWNLPENGEIVHKGYRYITTDGILVTVIPDRKAVKEWQKERKEKDAQGTAD